MSIDRSRRTRRRASVASDVAGSTVVYTHLTGYDQEIRRGYGFVNHCGARPGGRGKERS